MITNTTNVVRYLISGNTYAITYGYWAKSEIKVYLTKADDTLQQLTLTTDYTLTDPDGVSGTLTKVSNWGTATKITIQREVALDQGKDFVNGQVMDAEKIEEALDHSIAAVQQITERMSRSVEFRIDEIGQSLVMPSKTERQGTGEGTVFCFDSTGEAVTLRDLAGFDDDVESASNNASAAATSATSAASSASASATSATASATSATSAASSATSAAAAQSAIENMTVSAHSESGSTPTVTKTETAGIVNLNFGLIKGDTGDSGVYVGTTAPTDPDKDVWIDTSGTAAGYLSDASVSGTTLTINKSDGTSLTFQGGGGTWSSVTGKPFSTVGSGLKVENDILKVDTTDTAEADNTKPITSNGAYLLVGNINSLLATI